MRKRRHSGGVVALVLAGLATVLAACGGAGSASTSSSTTHPARSTSTSTSDPEDREVLAAYRAALAGLLGLGLGWLGWPAVVTGVLAAWCLAAMAVAVRRLGRSGAGGGTLALAPWLGAGVLVALVVR